MNAIEVAARFAAFACYLNAETAPLRSAEDAGKFARRNWKRFLPLVDQDLARLFATRSPAEEVPHAGNLATAQALRARAAS